LSAVIKSCALLEVGAPFFFTRLEAHSVRAPDARERAYPVRKLAFAQVNALFQLRALIAPALPAIAYQRFFNRTFQAFFGFLRVVFFLHFPRRLFDRVIFNAVHNAPKEGRERVADPKPRAQKHFFVDLNICHCSRRPSEAL
jgi:hypothetical protein